MEEFSDFDVVAQQNKLPPGFRFHPTDEELITHYLSAKVLDCSFSAEAIGQVDLNKVEPWELPWKAKMGEKEWYFFCLRDRKYPTGLRTNRATDAGYWKATGKDKEIFRAKILIGMRKTLVFYGGRAPRGEKTDWIMHEYRLEGNNPLKNAQNEWVICRIFKKTPGGKKLHISGLMKMTDYGPNSTSSDLSLLMEMSSDESHTKRFVDTELSHSTCFSSPMEGHRKNFLHALINSSPLQNSDFSTPNSSFTSQALIIPRAQDLHHPGSHAMVQDQSILFRDMNPKAKSDSSHDTGMDTDIYSVISSHLEDEFKPFEDQDFAPTLICPVDLDCSWDF